MTAVEVAAAQKASLAAGAHWADVALEWAAVDDD